MISRHLKVELLLLLFCNFTEIVCTALCTKKMLLFVGTFRKNFYKLIVIVIFIQIYKN